MFNRQASRRTDRQPDRATTRIEGHVIFIGGLRVDGMVRGNVQALADQPGTLVVASDARIDGEVQAAHIVVNGVINGPVHATETLELQAGSRVKGDVYYKSIEIHQGAVVEGRLVHHAAEMGRRAQLASADSHQGHHKSVTYSVAACLLPTAPQSQ